MKIIVTNNIQALKKHIDLNDETVVIDNQTQFNSVAINEKFFYEYLFVKDKRMVKIPSQIFKLEQVKNQKNLIINKWVYDAKILNGKKVANNILKKLKLELDNINKHPNKNELVIIQLGNNDASSIYIKNKLQLATNLNIAAKHVHLSSKTTQEDLLNVIYKFNRDKNVNAILVQMPLPTHIDANAICAAIDPLKDVDCFNQKNLGDLFLNTNSLFVYPCTPLGCIKLLEAYKLDLKGKHIVVVGRSNIVGKPLSLMCLHKDATVTLCHSKTKNLKKYTKQADILITAIGKAKIINKDFVKKDCICLDVGINRDKTNKMCGDIDFKSVYPKVKYITPVPNGIGPMTLAMLFENFKTLIEIKKVKKS